MSQDECRLTFQYAGGIPAKNSMAYALKERAGGERRAIRRETEPPVHGRTGKHVRVAARQAVARCRHETASVSRKGRAKHLPYAGAPQVLSTNRFAAYAKGRCQ